MKHETEMCMNIAPGIIAACVCPSPDGILRTPWCHDYEGHTGPHRCGDFRWENTIENKLEKTL